MGAAVVLAFSEQQHLGRVAAGRTNPGHVARQALAVTRCRKQRGRHGGLVRCKVRGESTSDRV